MNYTLSDLDVLDIIDRAVSFGVMKASDKNKKALTIASIWLEGYIYGNEPRLTEDDINSLHATMNNYFFI